MRKSFRKIFKIFNLLQDKLDKSIKESEQDEKILKQNLIWARSLTWVLIGTSLTFIGWLSIAKTDEILVANGKLEPIGKVKEIQIPSGGVAKSILVESGNLVEEGQVLINIKPQNQKQNFLALTQQWDQKPIQ